MAVDAACQEIVAQVMTETYFADIKAVSTLLSQTSRRVKTVVADGAYDKRCSRDEIKLRKAKALIPPSRNARVRGKDCDRDDVLCQIRGFGNDELM